jgi:hypothetical protein
VADRNNLPLIGKFIAEAYQAADLDYNIDKAVEWGEGFAFPPDAHTRDATELIALGYDLTALVRKRQQELQPDRLNPNRVAERDPAHPDTVRLKDIAEVGIRIPLDEDFLEDRVPPKHDATYSRAHSAIDKMWYDLYTAGFVLLIPTTIMARVPASTALNYSPPGWARKRGKESGRPTSDHSRRNHWGHALNTKHVKEVVRAMYGDIQPVQIDELMVMILEQVDRLGGWEDLVLWKMDLKGAFNLVFFRPEDAGLLAMELSEGLTMVSLVGSFGHTATPFGFDPVSRAILADVRDRIQGDARICCDDLMGCCATWEREGDMDIARDVITSLLGSKSVAEKKSEWTSEVVRGLDFIGWAVDLDQQRLGIARHNVLKVFYGFCQMRQRTHLSVREVMKLASWSNRYSLVCRWMRPFSSYLYSASSGFHNLETMLEVSDDMRIIMDLWIMFLVLMELEPARFTRPITTFRKSALSLHVNLDASLTGIGLIMTRPVDSVYDSEYDPSRSGLQDHRAVFAVSGYELPYLLGGDSSYQNTVEFIAIVVSLLVVASLGLLNESVLIQGDSTTALSWSSKEQFRVGRSSAAAVCLMQLHQFGGGSSVSAVDHIPGALNPSDPLSRGTSPEDLGYRSSSVLRIEDNPTLVRLIARMNPANPVILHEHLTHLWSSNLQDFEVLFGTTGGWTIEPEVRRGRDVSPSVSSGLSTLPQARAR